MRFWDTSALVPLLVREPGSAGARARMEEDPEVVAWWGTPIECASALARMRREELLSVEEETLSLRVLERLGGAWLEIVPSDAVRARARRLLRTHPLRGADALQLAAALVWSNDDAAGRELVTLDERLARVAELEGFRVLA